MMVAGRPRAGLWLLGGFGPNLGRGVLIIWATQVVTLVDLKDSSCCVDLAAIGGILKILGFQELT